MRLPDLPTLFVLPIDTAISSADVSPSVRGVVGITQTF